jgi:hypothetical protein
MDGMGETYRAMLNAQMRNDTSYTSDLSFGLDSFQCIPSDLQERSRYSNFDFREAESVYVFEKKEHAISIRVRVSLLYMMMRNAPCVLLTLMYFSNVLLVSPSLRDLPRNTRHRHCTITALKIWTVPEPCIHELRRTFLVTGMPVVK